MRIFRASLKNALRGGLDGLAYVQSEAQRLRAETALTRAVDNEQATSEAVGELMVKHFNEGSIDTVEVIYPRFTNTLTQEPRVRPVLPVHSLREFVTSLADGDASTHLPPEDKREVHFEPSAAEVLDALLPFYVNRQIYQFVLSAKASEHSARMVAMKTAKDNATSLLEDLTLEYNKARQAAITQEILEIAAAQFAGA